MAKTIIILEDNPETGRIDIQVLKFSRPNEQATTLAGLLGNALEAMLVQDYAAQAWQPSSTARH